MTSQPFAVLGLVPTNDLGAVKRAYFGLLPRHRPETDPEGFRRLREAYEQLSSVDRLAAAYVSAPIDLAAAEREYVTPFDERIATCGQELTQRLLTESAVEHFIERFARQPLDEALNRLG